MAIIINQSTFILSDIKTAPVAHAMDNLRRDLKAVCTDAEETKTAIVLEQAKLPGEAYEISAENGNLIVRASDELGFVYGIYGISRDILGVHNFWFWNDQKFVPTDCITVPDDYKRSVPPSKVRFRGWFVNDEVLIQAWSVDRKKEKPWEMVFEALLRCGGNMVIPGTDLNARLYRRMASDMGLYITHHHAEPLGAEMFARAYPGLTASYDQYAGLFEGLWKQGIEEQRHMKVLWNLGFRGQGDRPFWEDDPRYDTPESRGKLMSALVRKQYDMVREQIPDAVCCTNLYGETMELYKNGFLDFPDDVIKIWADNGFGKMVSRRQGNHNPRVYSLPSAEDGGKHGIYYHVSFYDLQAANHMTMLPNSPEFVKHELQEVMEHHADDYWIVNCSNVKPHVYFLDLVAQMWRDGDVDIETHRREYVRTYYGADAVRPVTDCLTQYPKYALAYGQNEDEHAGEQFSNHVTRMLISQYMKNKDKATEDLLWATDAKTLPAQSRWFGALCVCAAAGYEEYERLCERTALSLPADAEMLFRDSILLQAQLHRYCFRGAARVSRSLEYAFAGNYQRAFYEAGLAREDYLRADQCMRDREHGKWNGFYANDCFADMKQTAWLLQGLMYNLRNEDDGPHFYRWQKEFLYAREDSRIMLLLNLENHLNNEEIFQLMKERWEG